MDDSAHADMRADWIELANDMLSTK
jgi:hypothetical protein